MFVYYFLFLLFPLVLCGAFSSSRETNITVLAVVVVVAMLFSGFRWDSDVDHMEYASIFHDTPLLRDFSPEAIRDLYGEPGYLFISSVFRSLGFEFFALSFVSAAFSIISKALVIRRFARSAGLVLCLYFCVHFITIEFIQIRWAIASALIVLAFLCQYQRKPGLMLFLFAIAVSVHYFSVIFFLIAMLVYITNEKLLYSTLLLLLIVGGLVASGEYSVPEFIEGDAYILQRIVRYLSETLSTVGLISYLKLTIYPVSYYLLTYKHPSISSDSAITYLRKLSFTSIVISLILTVVPIMHHRAVVITDFFSLILLVRLIEHRCNVMERLAAFSIAFIAFGTWFIFDVGANISNNTIYEYKAWLFLVL